LIERVHRIRTGYDEWRARNDETIVKGRAAFLSDDDLRETVIREGLDAPPGPLLPTQMHGHLPHVYDATITAIILKKLGYYPDIPFGMLKRLVIRWCEPRK
jgi:hypothetical protein